MVSDNIFCFPGANMAAYHHMCDAIDWCQERKIKVNIGYNVPFSWHQHGSILPHVCLQGFAPGRENYGKYLIQFSVFLVPNW